ncbi:MAG TPA: GNAT family N-acetyltransferase [Herpetosiphonaceae bacterium]
MSSIALHDDSYRRDLGDRLVLRWSTPADTDELARLYGNVFRQRVSQPPNRTIAAWTRVMMSGEHPLLGPTDFAVVEDTGQQQLVAATNLMRQVWTYAGIPLQVGRPEVVATEAEHRHRGLIRAIFELIHARSAARGDLVLGITGIGYYYRQFGYEYALDLGGGCNIPFSAIPARSPHTPEIRLRPATIDDIPDLLRLWEHEHAHSLVTTQIDAGYWRFLIDGNLLCDPDSGWRTLMLVDRDDQTLGYALLHPKLWGPTLAVKGLIVRPGASFHALLPDILRAIQTEALALPVAVGSPPPTSLSLGLGREHPVYAALTADLPVQFDRPYAWYVRVPDLVALMRKIAPVLERRIAESVLVGYSGEIKINLYRGGLRLAFEKGVLRTVEPWQIAIWNAAVDAAFPPLVFLQLLFGHRSLDQLRDMFPDVSAGGQHQLLLQTLFPARPSLVMPLD